MKYRIVEIEKGFLVQKRVLFRWRNVEQRVISKCKNGLRVTASTFFAIWDTIDKAKEYLYTIRKFPFKYRGHVIECSLDLDKNLYYYEKRKGNPYHVVSDYAKIIEYIDMEKEEKEKEKKESKSRILKIYDEHGNQKNRQID